MARGEVLGICVICGKEIRSRWGGVQKDGLWVCVGRCYRTYNKEKKTWSLEKWERLLQIQAEYDHPVQTGEVTGTGKLPEKVKAKLKAAVGDKKILGFVTGFGIQKLTPIVVVTEESIVLYDPRLFGANKTEIPFAQILSASYELQMAKSVPYFCITTQSGKTELTLSGGKEDTHEPALALFSLLREKLSELAAVPISETHNKGLMKEVWSFYAPPQLAMMGGKPSETKTTECIPDQIRKLAELRDAGILSPEEFENKKKELLARL